MPLFAYRSTTLEGAVAEGVVEALDRRGAIEKLRDSGVIPLEVREPPRSGRQAWLAFRGSRGDLPAFTAELSTLLAAGLPLDRSLQILADITEHRGMRATAQSLLRSVREGASFSEALQRHPETFSRLYVSMVRAGEAGGFLDAILERLGEYLESARELRDHVVSALIYPAILLATGGASIVVLLVFVLPRFSVIFAEIGTALPVSTKIVLALSGFLRSWGLTFLAFLAAAALLARQYAATGRGRRQWDALKLRLAEDVVRKLETARFCRTLGTLLAGGVPLLQALANARDVIGNRVIAEKIEEVARGAKEGRGIAEPLARTGAFPPLALSMIAVGEETGQLEPMLLRIAAAYEKSLRQAVRRLLAVLEPVLILALGLVIGFVVISMLLAVFSISDIPL